MQNKDYYQDVENQMQISLFNSKDPENLPESNEELSLHMQLDYKQAIEIAEEQAINVLLKGNRYDLTKRRVNYDLATIGMGCVKNTFTQSEGVKVEYVDPANIVYSYTESPYFEDIYYVGEVKQIPINELKKQFPELEESDLKEIVSQGYQKSGYSGQKNSTDNNQIDVLYFNYKTYMNEVYKVKETATGASKAIIKDDKLILEAELFSLDGSQRFYEKKSSKIENAKELGRDVGQILKTKSNNSYKR